MRSRIRRARRTCSELGTASVFSACCEAALAPCCRIMCIGSADESDRSVASRPTMAARINAASFNLIVKNSARAQLLNVAPISHFPQLSTPLADQQQHGLVPIAEWPQLRLFSHRD